MSSGSTDEIPFIDLDTQYRRNKAAIDTAIQAVLDHGRFIMGPEVAQFEAEFARYCEVRHAVGCANGTDALQLALMGEGIGPGDAVFIPSFTFTATAEAALVLGARPVFCDIDETNFNIAPDSLKERINLVRQAGNWNPRAVIAVDLFGQPAPYATLRKICDSEGVTLIADAAQSCGAVSDNRRVGSLAPITTTSFFPAKPLGCYGDGGAILTADPERADRYRSLRAHGKGGAKYDIVRVGLNSRLDTLQAAVLLEKLKLLPDELERRNEIAETYTNALEDLVAVPRIPPGTRSAWAQYTIRTENRDALRQYLAEHGIPTAVYYPLPMHLQSAYREFEDREGALPVSEQCARTVLSLPMHPYLCTEVQARIIERVREFFAG